MPLTYKDFAFKVGKKQLRLFDTLGNPLIVYLDTNNYSGADATYTENFRVDIPTPPPEKDFWRSGIGATTLPDGTTDLTENIRRNGKVGINADAHSTLHSNGSLATTHLYHGVTSTNLTLNDTHHTVCVSNNQPVSKTITLPSPFGLNGREYILYIDNQATTGGATIVTPSNFIISDVGPSTNTLVMTPSTIRRVILSSDGVNWHATNIDRAGTSDGYNKNILRTNSNTLIAPTTVEFLAPKNGDSATIMLADKRTEHWNYQSGAWVRIFITADDVVDVSGVTMPVTFPVTSLPGVPVFNPNTPATLDTLYVISNGTTTQYARWNGSQYISSSAPVNNDFWRSNVAMTTTPDGVSDITETIYRTGNVNIGNNTTPNPDLTLHSNANTNGSGGTINFYESDSNYGSRIRHNTNAGTIAEGLVIGSKNAGVYTEYAVFDQTFRRTGLGTLVPNSNLHAFGSLATKCDFYGTNTNLTLDATHHKIELGSGASGKTLFLPNPTTVKDREYVIYFSGDALATSTATITTTTGQIGSPNSTIGASSNLTLNRNGLRSVTLVSDGTNWHPHTMIYDATTSVKKFRVVQNLVAGANVITHNLALGTTPVIVETRDNATGSLIDVRVTTEASNTTTLTTAVAQNNVRITIIG